MTPITPIDFVGLGGVPLIQGLVAIIKTMFKRLPNKYIPATALLVGIVLNLGLATLLHTDYGISVFTGLVAGWLASKQYQASK